MASYHLKTVVVLNLNLSSNLNGEKTNSLLKDLKVLYLINQSKVALEN